MREWRDAVGGVLERLEVGLAVAALAGARLPDGALVLGDRLGVRRVEAVRPISKVKPRPPVA